MLSNVATAFFENQRLISYVCVASAIAAIEMLTDKDLVHNNEVGLQNQCVYNEAL